MSAHGMRPVGTDAGGTEFRLNPPPAPRDVERLRERYAGRTGIELIRAIVEVEFPKQVALVSSFGAESSVLLHMVASVNAATPVIFLETGKLFEETLAYRDRLVERLGLSAVRSVSPSPRDIAGQDPDGRLHKADPDRCCFLRKVAPLNRVLGEFAVWITGRKAYHGEARASLPAVEAVGDRVKVNPIVGWSRAGVQAYIDRHALPRHPLEADGFLSIGCMPCTERTADAGDIRCGRWKGSGKTECGIHSANMTRLTDGAVS